mmetsp:Transcript_30427/g.64419  ORF Transcript_30427/g.64419 Transcript_30427/m.64419 type:complete len:477 (+) Transcript_30427:261-1691(+)
MIGAGGLASFANDKGVFRWNDEGTKMVYTPNLQTSTDDNNDTNANNNDDVEEENNGFVFNERKKKWVVKDQVVGEKNVSFQQTSINRIGISQPVAFLRTQSNDSMGTGMTGMSEFTYDDIALDNAKRSRSGGTNASISVMGSVHSGGSSAMMGGGGGIGSSGNNSNNTRNGGMMNVPPPSPGTPQEQGVEVTAESMQPNPSNNTIDEFVSNTNVERFMMGHDDESTAFSGFTDFSNNNFTQLPSSAVPPPPPPLPNPITPERVHSQNSDAATMATFGTWGTGDPGRIVPKRKPSGGNNTMNKMKIAEDAPFDEDIPFDERTLPSRTRSGLSLSSSASTKFKKKKKKKSNNTSDTSSTGGKFIMPNMLDDIISMDDDQSETSEGSANSAQVLQDLDKLSRFMMDRKQSSKGGNGGGEARRSGAPSSRRSKGEGGGGGGGSKRMSSRKASFGSSGGNRSSSNKYSSDPNSSSRGWDEI